jgi:ankyrin repeat protein
MSPALPARPSLEHLKKQAKELLHSVEAKDPTAVERFRSLGIASSGAKLADAQHVIAREYGFSSWTVLKEHVESLEADENPRTALIDAAQADDVAKARALLQRHATLRAQIKDPWPEIPFGGRPIGAAAQHKSKEMVDLLLEFGADINARSDWWAGSFGVLDSGDPEFAQFLISRGARVDAHSAARLGMLDKLREIVSADPAVVHARGGDGQTPLHFASTIEIADYLLDNGADIDAIDVDHEGTPAQWMIGDRTEIARHLVRRGANADFLMAIALGDIALVRRYLDADPAVVRTTVTPDYFPMRDRHAGGHIYMWTLDRNRTAHEIARHFGHEDVLQLLMERSPEDVKLVAAARLGDEALARQVLAERPALGKDLPNAMHRKLVDAAQDENVAAVRLMLDAGWPTDARGHENATALHWAGFLGNLAIARELLEHGAAVDVKGDAYNGTPLSWAIYGSTNSWKCKTGDFVGVVRALLDAGAKMPERTDSASDAVREALRQARPPAT